MRNLILLIIVGIGLYLVYEKNNGKSWKKIIGFLLIGLGILFIEPTPDPLSVGFYAFTHNLDILTIDKTAILGFLIDYEIWSTLVGLILVTSGAAVLGWSFKKARNKLKL